MDVTYFLRAARGRVSASVFHLQVEQAIHKLGKVEDGHFDAARLY
jgi:hypothetical protein